MAHEFQRRYRPKKLEDIEGQPEVVKQLRKLLEKKKFPHAVCFSGPTGTGKSTAARILKKELNCGGMDFHEYNCASDGGIETVRAIRDMESLAPRDGDCTIFYLDEAHKLSQKEGKASDAQTALLKLVEDAPEWVYYILATSEEKGLRRTLLGRCSKFKFQALSSDAIKAVINRVLKAEEEKISSNVLEEIIEAAQGSGREALTILEQVLQLDNEKEQLNSIVKTEVKAQAFELVRLLIWNRKGGWPAVASAIKSIDISNPEMLRRLILAIARTEILKASQFSKQAYLVITAFSTSGFWESGAVGEAALCGACYEVAGG